MTDAPAKPPVVREDETDDDIPMLPHKNVQHMILVDPVELAELRSRPTRGELEAEQASLESACDELKELRAKLAAFRKENGV